MWTRLASLALLLAGGTAYAQSADESASGLESCFLATHLGDAICSKLSNDPARRSDCFKRTRTAQLECLEHVLSEGLGPSGTPQSSPEAARPAPPVDAAPAEALSERPAEANRADSSVGNADESEKRPNASPKSNLENAPPPAAEVNTGAIRADKFGEKDDRPARQTDWILSETTSPLDYSPLVTAVIRSTSDVKGGPNSLLVRCRAQHTELSIQTDGAWSVPRGNDLMVDYQINGQLADRQPWILSTDGKTATYRNDPVVLLRSIPEGATLKVAVTDNGNVRREAIFELTGLSGVRQKVGTACKWAPVTAKTSSERR